MSQRHPLDAWERLVRRAQRSDEPVLESPSDEWTDRLLERWRAGEGRGRLLLFEDTAVRVALSSAVIAASILLLLLLSDFSIPIGTDDQAMPITGGPPEFVLSG